MLQKFGLFSGDYGHSLHVWDWAKHEIIQVSF